MGLDDQLLQANSSNSNDSGESNNSDSNNSEGEPGSSNNEVDNDSASRAGEYRAERRQGPDAEAQSSTNDIRADVQKAKLEQKKKEDSEKKKSEEGAGGITGAVSSKFKSPFTEVLKDSWLNLIDSIGLTLIYINFHAFAHAILPKVFCALGEEWVPDKMPGGSGGGSPKEIKKAKKVFGLVEIMGLGLLDLVVYFIIVVVAGIIITVVQFVSDPAGSFIKYV